ncbi:MAG TPA: DUF177 domain-containing protein [Candidatus Eisenbacteria bacterium]|jgi:uncharacterized metal-binding protein YceD (DUF177 family)|nr:DUF177 domain-containing protein [Candidatus Eisenbacteria bacterium]
MKIDLSHFPKNKALVLQAEIQPADLDLDIGVMHFPEPLSLNAEAWKEEDDLTVNVHLEGAREFTCSLCLEPFNNLFEKDFTLHYDIKGLDFVNIDQDVRDEIILDHPIRVLCRPDCRGLCSQCGANLNAGPCGCKTGR